MDSRNTDYDVIVIGGGPAGSCAGTALARAGSRVLVIDKAPRTALRIGESLLPNGNGLLRRIGVWDKVESAGFIKKYGAEFETADGSRRVENIFARGLRPDLDYSYQVERPRFDELLLDHAAACGCEVARDTEVTDVVDSGNRHSLTTADGRMRTARWLIDASGRRRILGRLWKLPTEPNPYPSRIAVYSHFRNVARRSGPEGGHIIITRLPEGWFWHIPISATLTSVGLVTLTSRLRESGMRPEVWFQHNLDHCPAVARRMETAEATAPFATATDYAYMFQQFAGPRHLLVGDAATFSDPVFSSGVYLGMESALDAARSILQAEAAGTELSPKAQARYTRGFKQSTRLIRRLIDTFYDEAGFAVFMNPTDKFRLFAAVNSIVAGNTRPSLAIRWRYALFRLICRLNKNCRLIPSVLAGSGNEPAQTATHASTSGAGHPTRSGTTQR